MVKDGLFRFGLRAAYRGARIWWFIRRPKHEASLVAIWQAKKLLLVRQSYRRALCLPGGGLTRNETPDEAAIREVQEEIGLSLTAEAVSLTLVLETVSDFRPSKIRFYETKLSDPPVIRVDRREIISACFYELDSLPEMDLDPLVEHYMKEFQRSDPNYQLALSTSGDPFERNFTAQAPDRPCVADITYIPT